MLRMWKRMGLTAKIVLLFNSLNVLILVVYGLISVRIQVAEKISEIDAELAIAAQSYVRVVGEGTIVLTWNRKIGTNYS